MLLPVIFSFIAKTYVVDIMSTYCNMRRCYLAGVIVIYVCGRCYYWPMLLSICGRCYGHFWCNVGADVIANVFVADVMTTYITEADVFACYITLLLADVIAKTYVVDIMSTYCNMRRCYLAGVIVIYVCGRCYNH